MDANCVRFVEELIKTCGGLKVAVDETEKYWAPDPPLATVLFSTLGREFVKQFDNIPSHTRKSIFKQIEDAFTSTDENLKTAVATGMAEAIYSEAIKYDGCWEQIELELGPASKNYVNAWLDANL